MISTKKLLYKVCTALSLNVCETGTDNGWSYRKYRDGTYDAWKSMSVETPTANWDSLSTSWYKTPATDVTLPSFSKDGEDVFIAGASNRNGVVCINTQTASPPLITIALMRYSSTSSALAVKLTLHGMWE